MGVEEGTGALFVLDHSRYEEIKTLSQQTSDRGKIFTAQWWTKGYSSMVSVCG